ncbi:hypothetical protein CHS0354_021375 [Potamilus streckersoni]|uniref:Mab-21-like HhH/H2TH-like domain-containing protein n=1 Tax=Potamilus streckersoni TaxID=2493646 RepID=A0AAE0VPS3_9BIVA|nr:hypothetical protein CHS0354_021375 [Potamilus streckersoni]
MRTLLRKIVFPMNIQSKLGGGYLVGRDMCTTLLMPISSLCLHVYYFMSLECVVVVDDDDDDDYDDDDDDDDGDDDDDDDDEYSYYDDCFNYRNVYGFYSVLSADMTHQFREHYCSVSERLSNILDNVGYSRGDRDRKVTFATETEVFMSIGCALSGKVRTYIFGSRGEGSTGPGLQSDIDFLHENNTVKVVTELFQCQPDMINMLMVNDSHTHPGYVKLQHIRKSPFDNLIALHEKGYIDNVTTIDLLNRTLLLNTAHHRLGTISGPSLHADNDPKELSTDHVNALRCMQWPQEGHEWFLRRRLNGWPTPIQIGIAREYGCFVTPVGHPHSSECLIEWRLSFSIAERDFTRSFEDTTMKVYILLKMIKKTYIEPVVGDAFSSYHCKVCIFWMRERTSYELWRNENLLQCLILCIRQLYEWATTGFCPDYFIVTNNIYDRKIIGAYPLKHAMMILWSQLGFHVATICKENEQFLFREQVDYLVALASSCLSFGINSDTTSVRLKLCGMAMELGNYYLTETSLQHISDFCMKYIFSATMNHVHCCESRIEMLCRNRYNTEELLQTQTSYSVAYLPSEMSITPKPLKMEMFRSVGTPSELKEENSDSWFDWGVLDSLMCLYFFQYLNFSRQRKVKHKQVALDNMIHVISTDPEILHRDTALNVLGYSFTQENQLTKACRCFMESLKIRPYYNAAKFYLGILFNRIHATGRGPAEILSFDLSKSNDLFFD